MTHKQPTVSPPQAQETTRDIIVRLARYMLQQDRARANAQALVGQLEERNGQLRDELAAMERTAHAIADERMSMANEIFQLQRQLGETQAALTEAQETIAALQHAAHMPDDYKYGLPTWINMVLYAAYIGLDIGPHNRKWAVQMEERWESAMLQIRDAHNVLNAAGVPSEKHEPHEGCATQLGHRIRILLTNAESGGAG